MEDYKDGVSGHGRSTYEFTTVVPACTSPVQVQASPNPTWRGGNEHEPHLGSC